MRQRKTKKLPPRGNGDTKLTVEQLMQLVAKRHPKIIQYLGTH